MNISLRAVMFMNITAAAPDIHEHHYLFVMTRRRRRTRVIFASSGLGRQLKVVRRVVCACSSVGGCVFCLIFDDGQIQNVPNTYLIITSLSQQLGSRRPPSGAGPDIHEYQTSARPTADFFCKHDIHERRGDIHEHIDLL